MFTLLAGLSLALIMITYIRSATNNNSLFRYSIEISFAAGFLVVIPPFIFISLLMGVGRSGTILGIAICKATNSPYFCALINSIDIITHTFIALVVATAMSAVMATIAISIVTVKRYLDAKIAKYKECYAVTAEPAGRCHK